eukprot:1946084-Pleurochrysis_carterae.AAC.1
MLPASNSPPCSPKRRPPQILARAWTRVRLRTRNLATRRHRCPNRDRARPHLRAPMARHPR